MLDNFNNDQEDFQNSNPFDTELWELESLKKFLLFFFLYIYFIFILLKSHYCPEIPKLLTVFEEGFEEIDFLDLDNFMKIDYDDMIALNFAKIKVIIIFYFLKILQNSRKKQLLPKILLRK